METLYVLYLLIFRLAIITAGVVCVVLGYKLFLQNLKLGEQAAKGNTDLEANFKGTQIKLKNAAPGTLFSLFGAALISVMLVQSPPEVTDKTQTRQQVVDSTGVERQVMMSRELSMRGDEATVIDEQSLHALMATGLQLEKDNNYTEATKTYEQAVWMMAEPMNALAWRYYELGQYQKARSISEVAVSLVPDEANFNDTLAQILFSLGAYQKAYQYMKTAADLAPNTYGNELERFRVKLKD